jgi:hypothetical protein
MCRYASKAYKTHFACFHCRKAFKQASYADLLQRIGKANYYEKLSRKPIMQLSEKEVALLEHVDKTIQNREIKCPQCGGYMADLGLDFKSPKQTAVKEWRIIKGLYTIGMSFHSCGCNGIGYIPQNPKDYELYLENVLGNYQKQIAYYQNKTLNECGDKIERIRYWSDQIQTVEAELPGQKLKHRH